MEGGKEESLIRQSIWMTPKGLLIYDDARSTGFEGNLSDFINEKITGPFEEQTIEYFCVFKQQECPVRKQYKLKPENLIKFCQICPDRKLKFGSEK